MVSPSVLYRSSITATSDIPFKLVHDDVWFESVDILFYDNAAFLGDLRDQDVLLNANDIYYLLHPCNLGNFFIKNAVAGSNTRVVVAGILLSDERKRELGIVVD